MVHSIPFKVRQCYNFANISLAKEIFRKYLKENCSSQLSITLLQIFCKFMLLSKVIFKSMTGPDDDGQANLKAWIVKLMGLNIGMTSGEKLCIACHHHSRSHLPIVSWASSLLSPALDIHIFTKPQLKTLLEIFLQSMRYFQVIFRSTIGPYDTSHRNLCA